MASSPATFWHRRARWTALRHNVGAALDGLLPLCLGWSAVSACVLLVARQNKFPLFPAFWPGLLICAVVAVWRMHRRFFTVEDALVRLEWVLGLNNRLSAAAAGVGTYPEAQSASDGFAFRWRKIALYGVGSMSLVWAAAWVPVSGHGPANVPVAAPVAWTQTAAWIDALKKTDTVQEPALEDLRDRLEQLRNQPAEDWYSQSSLEAGDNLREQATQSMQSLQRDLRSALGALDAMQRSPDGTPSSEMKAARENLSNALRGLELGNLPLNHEGLANLKQADLSGVKTLTPAQLEELKRSLKAGDKVCAACLHPSSVSKPDGTVVAVDRSVPGGKGGGNASPPLNLDEPSTDLATKTLASVSNPNLDHALPGDLVGVSKGDHPVNPAKYAGPAPGGTVATNGQGGEAVWRDDLTPAERNVVKTFFK